MIADVKSSHLLGGFEWRLFSDYVERIDCRGYRRLFDRVFYDEIESMTVFRKPDSVFFVRGMILAALTVPWLLLLRVATPNWALPLLVTLGTFALLVVVLAALAFGRGKTVVRLHTTTVGDSEILFNRSSPFARRFVDRLVPLIRAAQERTRVGSS